MYALSRLGLWSWLTLCGVCLCLASGQSALADGRVLRITNPETGSIAQLPLHRDDRIAIRFFHSYDRQWVVESFRIVGDSFVPTEVSYVDDSYDYHDQRYKSRALLEPGRVRLVDIIPLPSDHLKTIATRVAHTRPQQLVLKREGERKVFLFNQWGSPGQLLVFSLK